MVDFVDRNFPTFRLKNVNDKGEEIEITIKRGKGRKDRILFLNNGGGDALETISPPGEILQVRCSGLLAKGGT